MRKRKERNVGSVKVGRRGQVNRARMKLAKRRSRKERDVEMLKKKV